MQKQEENSGLCGMHKGNPRGNREFTAEWMEKIAKVAYNRKQLLTGISAIDDAEWERELLPVQPVEEGMI